MSQTMQLNGEAWWTVLAEFPAAARARATENLVYLDVLQTEPGEP